MPSLKDVKTKISGVRKTKQITKAMNMVSSAKLRSAQNAIEGFRPYAEKYCSIIMQLTNHEDTLTHALLTQREQITNSTLILMTSDRGLCGAFNLSLIEKALALAKQKEHEGQTVQFICIGKKGYDAIKKTNYTIIQNYTDIAFVDFSTISKIKDHIIEQYEHKITDSVTLIYGQFSSIAKQVVTAHHLLPIQKIAPEDNHQVPQKNHADYIYEPNVAELLEKLLPKFLTVQIYRGLLDTTASEHAARMTAMDNATRNCDDIVENLTRLFNKTRQASITRELIDIVSGAEALK